VIEDAACAIGSQYFGQRIGMPHSLLACFSFHPRKVLTTGEGGMVTTAEQAVADRLKRLRQHAMSASDVARHNSRSVVFESYDEVGFNYRMTDIQAALGIVQLGRVEGFVSRRRALAERYSNQLAQLGWLITPAEPRGCRHNFQSYMARLQPDAPISRDSLMQELLDRGVSSRRGVMAAHREAPYYDPKWDRLLPHTNLAADGSIILPLFHQMTEHQQDYVIESICEAGSGSRL
jgi:perosamine synthetase